MSERPDDDVTVPRALVRHAADLLAAPSPMTLWRQAAKEHPTDDAERAARYVELMREAGHIIDREEGDDSPLFACGFDPRDGVDPYVRPGDPALNPYKHGPNKWPGV